MQPPCHLQQLRAEPRGRRGTTYTGGGSWSQQTEVHPLAAGRWHLFAQDLDGRMETPTLHATVMVAPPRRPSS